MEASAAPGPHQACEKAFGLSHQHNLSLALLRLAQDFRNGVRPPGAHLGCLAAGCVDCRVRGVHLEKPPFSPLGLKHYSFLVKGKKEMACPDFFFFFFNPSSLIVRVNLLQCCSQVRDEVKDSNQIPPEGL